MGFFDFLHHGKPSEAAETHTAHANGAAHPVTRDVKFDPDLVPRLKDEHRALLSLFNAIQQAHQAGDFEAIKRALQKFQITLSLHLGVEHNEFYAYLNSKLKKNSHEHHTMTAFIDEMQSIGQSVMHFLRKYNHTDFTPDMQASFGSELAHIGTALTNRIKHEEEQLYGLYTPF